MTEERFIIIQDGDNFTVKDTVEKKPMGMFEFKEDEFPVFFCFHEIIDLLNELNNENKKLKEANDKLQFRTVDMLDYIKEKGTVTHQEMKEWWNKRVME